VFGSHRRSRRTKSDRPKGSRTGWTLCLPPLRTRPSRDVTAETLGGTGRRDSTHTAAELREGLIARGRDGLPAAVPTRPTGPQGRPRTPPTVAGGSRDGTPDPRTTDVIGVLLRVVGPFGEGCDAPACQCPYPGGQGDTTGHAPEVPARPHCLLKPGRQRGGTRQGELPCLPRRLPGKLPQSHASNRVTRR
jgi:hypothetical protein